MSAGHAAGLPSFLSEGPAQFNLGMATVSREQVAIGGVNVAQESPGGILMTDTKTKDIIANPSKEFAHPSEVVTTPDLSHKEKAAALEEWELDARLMQVATEEGMAGIEGAEPNKLVDVKKAQSDLGIDTLKKKDDSGGPNKSGM